MISNFAVVMNDLFMSAALIVLDCHRHNHQYSDSELINKRWYTAKKNPVTELVIWWLTNLWPVRKSVKGSVILLAGTVSSSWKRSLTDPLTGIEHLWHPYDQQIRRPPYDRMRMTRPMTTSTTTETSFDRWYDQIITNISNIFVLQLFSYSVISCYYLYYWYNYC